MIKGGVGGDELLSYPIRVQGELNRRRQVIQAKSNRSGKRKRYY